MGKVREYVTLGVLVSFCAQTFTLPVILYHFGRVSLLGPVSNLIVLPLVSLVVAAGLEAAIAAVFWERLALVFMKAASVLASAILASMSFLTRFLDPVVFTGRPCLWKMIVYSTALAYLGLLRPAMNKRLKLLLLITAYAFMVAPLPSSSSGLLRVTFIYVGDGDACVIETPSGKTLLVDAGSGGKDYDAGRVHVLPLLALKGKKRLDAVIVTHAHNDHYGGLATLMESVTIAEVLVGTLKGEEAYESLLEETRQRGIPVRQTRRGNRLEYGDVVIEILHPSEDYSTGAQDPNAQSVVLRLSYGQTSFLLTGDVTPGVQRELLEQGYVLRCDVLKVPHHGAPDAVEPAFLDALGAGTAVISVGSRFSSHPSPETIELLESKGLQTLSTISDGAITIETDGTSIRVKTEVRSHE